MGKTRHEITGRETLRNEETNIMNRIMLAMSKKGWLVWRNNVGLFKTPDGKRSINIGVKGSPDIMAIKPTIITPDMVGQTVGIFVGVEVKTATGRQSEAQKKWQGVAESKGIEYILARSEDDI